MRLSFIGLAVLIVVAVAFPFELVQDSGVALNASWLLAALLCGSWLLRILVLRKHSDLEPSRIAVAASAFIVITLVAFLVGQFPWFHAPGAPISAQAAQLGVFILSAGLFLVLGHQIRHLRYLRWLTWLFLLAGGIFCLTQSVPGLETAARWSSPESVGSMFWIWLVAISTSQALFNKELPATARILLFGLTALALYRGLFLTASWASGWLPSLVALTIIFMFRLPRTIAGIGMMAIPGGLYWAGRAMDLVMIHEQYSWMTRLEAWRVLWQLFEKSPLIGLGPANYYYYTLLYPILGWYVSFSSHNNYIDILMQTGILGLLAFCWLILEIIGAIFRLLRSLNGDSFAKAYLIGALGGLAGALVSGMLADWILPFVYNVGLPGFRSSVLFWLFLGGVLALKRMAVHQAHGSGIAPPPLPPQCV